MSGEIPGVSGLRLPKRGGKNMGRGLHSSTSQINLSRFLQQIPPIHPILPPKHPQTPP